MSESIDLKARGWESHWAWDHPDLDTKSHWFTHPAYVEDGAPRDCDDGEALAAEGLADLRVREATERVIALLRECSFEEYIAGYIENLVCFSEKLVADIREKADGG